MRKEKKKRSGVPSYRYCVIKARPGMVTSCFRLRELQRCDKPKAGRKNEQRNGLTVRGLKHIDSGTIGAKKHKWKIIMIISVGGGVPRKIKLASTAKNRKALMITGPAIWSRGSNAKKKRTMVQHSVALLPPMGSLRDCSTYRNALDHACGSW